MTAFNVARMRVKPDRESEFVDFYEKQDLSDYQGLEALHVVHTGEREYLVIAQWTEMSALTAARDDMLGTLDELRDRLEDLGGNLGEVQPRAGEAVVSRKP